MNKQHKISHIIDKKKLINDELEIMNLFDKKYSNWDQKKQDMK